MTIDFDNLTVLVGPNGSGKSNVCNALRFLNNAMAFGLDSAIIRQGGIESLLRWNGGKSPSLHLEITIELPEQPAQVGARIGPVTGHYLIRVGRSANNKYIVYREQFQGVDSLGSEVVGYSINKGVWSGPDDLKPRISRTGLVLPLLAGDSRFQEFVQSLMSIVVYSVSPATMRGAQVLSKNQSMFEDGSNWASVLRDLKADSGKADLLVALRRVAGDIDDYRVTKVASLLLTQFRHGQKKTKTAPTSNPMVERWYPIAWESDGTLRIAGILAALLQHSPPILMGFEEPEIAVHPGVIALLYDYLEEASLRGQILITTHSPELLELVGAEAVRVVERSQGITTVAPMDETQRRIVNERLTNPGELLRMQGLRQETASDPGT